MTLSYTCRDSRSLLVINVSRGRLARWGLCPGYLQYCPTKTLRQRRQLHHVHSGYLLCIKLWITIQEKKITWVLVIREKLIGYPPFWSWSTLLTLWCFLWWRKQLVVIVQLLFNSLDIIKYLWKLSTKPSVKWPSAITFLQHFSLLVAALPHNQ